MLNVSSRWRGVGGLSCGLFLGEQLLIDSRWLVETCFSFQSFGHSQQWYNLLETRYLIFVGKVGTYVQKLDPAQNMRPSRIERQNPNIVFTIETHCTTHSIHNKNPHSIHSKVPLIEKTDHIIHSWINYSQYSQQDTLFTQDIHIECNIQLKKWTERGRLRERQDTQAVLCCQGWESLGPPMHIAEQSGSHDAPKAILEIQKQ